LKSNEEKGFEVFVAVIEENKTGTGRKRYLLVQEF
jgi:hypothetical protein